MTYRDDLNQAYEVLKTLSKTSDLGYKDWDPDHISEFTQSVKPSTLLSIISKYRTMIEEKINEEDDLK